MSPADHPKDEPTEGLGNPARLVLASGSPRRREMLERMGLEAIVRPVDIDETPLPGEAPSRYVLRLAETKARAAAERGDLVLAADTSVVIDGRILGKPEGTAQAGEMLASLSGREHAVLTGVSVYDVDRQFLLAAVETTQVTFAPMSELEIAWYVATGEPLDKAGAYGIQGIGALFVRSIEGDYSNVVGLPLASTYRLMRQVGWDLLAF